MAPRKIRSWEALSPRTGPYTQTRSLASRSTNLERNEQTAPRGGTGNQPPRLLADAEVLKGDTVKDRIPTHAESSLQSRNIPLVDDYASMTGSPLLQNDFESSPAPHSDGPKYSDTHDENDTDQLSSSPQTPTKKRSHRTQESWWTSDLTQVFKELEVSIRMACLATFNRDLQRQVVGYHLAQIEVPVLHKNKPVKRKNTFVLENDKNLYIPPPDDDDVGGSGDSYEGAIDPNLCAA
ncbi:hypothetical protein EDB80DRAFT_892060 [Ilyonectria destructans]|nr:hypothetical protein EDB80DRAFT_892060 [Ilyonectria destructans]